MFFDKDEFYGVAEGGADVAVEPELGEIIFFVKVAKDFYPEFWGEICGGLSCYSHVWKRKIGIVKMFYILLCI